MRSVVAFALLASACGRLDFDQAEDVGTTDGAPSCAIVLDLTTLEADGGFCWLIYEARGRWGLADTNDTPATQVQSSLRLFEDALELGPAHSAHDNIRAFGLGRFSHFTSTDLLEDTMRFSASDNTDPRTNGRTYTYCP